MKMYDSANDDLVVEEGKEVTMSPGIYLVMVHLCQKK
jgi:hypothetical protein